MSHSRPDNETQPLPGAKAAIGREIVADDVTVATRRPKSARPAKNPTPGAAPKRPPATIQQQPLRQASPARHQLLGGGERSAHWAHGLNVRPGFLEGGLLDGRYKLVKQLGEGGMGSVYLVDDLLLRRRSALKTLHLDALSINEDLERFRREVAITHNIHHPNVARTYDIGEERGVHYLSMEWLEGESLMDRLRRGDLYSSEELREIALPLCLGLRAAHRAGIVHRDLKPANIMLVQDERKVVIVDFGIAAHVMQQHKVLDGANADATDWGLEDAATPTDAALIAGSLAPRITGNGAGRDSSTQGAPQGQSATASGGTSHQAKGAGAALSAVAENMAWEVTSAGRGTPAYMAPEQWEQSTGDARTDIYGLGAILYVALTGKPPFGGHTIDEVAEKHQVLAPPDVREEQPTVDAGIAKLIQWCMAKRPEDRPQQIEEVIATLTMGRRRRVWLRSVAIAGAIAAMLTMTLHVGAFGVAKHAFIGEMQPALTRLARLAARDVPLADLDTLHKASDRHTAAFGRVHEVLKRYRRESDEIKAVYVMRTTDKPSIYQLIADDTPDEYDANHDGIIQESEHGISVGESYDGTEFTAMAKTIETGKAVADDAFAIDAWGVSLSGYAVIRKPTSTTPGLFLGVDAGHKKLNLLKRKLDSLLILLALLLVVAWATWTYPLRRGGTAGQLLTRHSP